MIVRKTSCDRDRLRRLAADDLPADEIPVLEEHLERCTACREALDDLADGESWIRAAREYLDVDPTAPHEPGPAMPPYIGIDEVLGALAPSDWPDSMGRLGTYEVKGVIGRGGMGVVFKAFDPALHRNVAIKVLSPHLAGTGVARRRFLREARAAAAVAHEHVVSVFAVVESAPLPYIVMEYVPGRSLQDRIDRDGPLELPDILRIGMQTAAGLAAAHAQGVVHRDVKPANILLENGIARVKLTDFGLARVVADAGMTQSGVVAGTPHYMAPEQARAEAADHRADLFSLGSTMYAMCTGIPPFRAETAYAVVRRVADDRARPIRELSPELPAWLEAIVERLHAKNPADRFASASELAELLGQCLAHVQQPMTVELPPGLIGLKPRTKPRSRWIAAAFAAVPVALGLALAYRVGWLPGNARPDRAAAAKETESPRSDTPLPRFANDDDLFREARDHAVQIDADLHRPASSPDEDRISQMTRALAQRAASLEQEMAPMGRSTPIPDPSTASNPKRR